MAKSMLGSLVLESSLMICSANRDFTPLLGNEIDVDMATEGETWDNVKERSTQIYEQLMRVINTLLVKITDMIRKIKKENKGAYTCRKHVYDAAAASVKLLGSVGKPAETQSNYEKIKAIREHSRDGATKKTVSVPAATVDGWFKTNSGVLKKLQAMLKAVKRKAVDAKYSKSDKAKDIKTIRQQIAICNASYNLCAQVVIHGGKKERTTDD